MAANYLPSKKFQKRAGIGLGVLALILTAGTLFNLDSNSTDDETAPLAFSKTDSDQDGLRDWEERIWGSDPFNPDSDNDGILDGLEVEDGRDPLKTGADELTDSRLASVYSGYKRRSLENINITDQISDKILPHSLLLANELRETDRLANTNRTDLLIQPVVNEYRISDNKLTIEDLNLVPANAESLTNYFTLVLETANSGLGNIGGNEVSLALNSDNLNVEKTLNNYRRVVNELSRASVPSPIAERHIAVLNNFIRMRDSFNLLLSAEEDDSAKKIYALDELKILQSQNLTEIERLAQAWRNSVDNL
jgi:hypothetical protein